MSQVQREDFERLYVEEELPYKEIAKHFGISKSLVGYYVNKYDIPKRQYRVTRYSHITKEILEELYLMKKKTSYEISEIFGCSQPLITYRLSKFKIPVRRIGPTKYWKSVENTRIISGKATDYELGLIVGLIEADGCLGLNIRPGGFIPYIQIANKNKEIHEKAQDIMGGTIQGVNLTICSLQTVHKTLQKLAPYLFSTKGKIARLLLKYCDLRSTHPYDSYTDEEIEIWKTIRVLNQGNKKKGKREDGLLEKYILKKQV